MYPDKITPEFIEIMKTEKKLVPHLHISLQSCDNEILKNMKRKYGREIIEEGLMALKKEVPNMEYTADVIVGFPGEREENFENTYNLIEKNRFF